MYPGGEPLRPGVDSFGFPSHFHDMLHEFPICHVNALLAGTLDTKAKDPSTGTASPPLINKDKPCYPKKKTMNVTFTGDVEVFRSKMKSSFVRTLQIQSSLF